MWWKIKFSCPYGRLDPPLPVLRAHSWPAGQTSPVVVHGPELTSYFLQHLLLSWHINEGSWNFGTQPSVLQRCCIFYEIPKSVFKPVQPSDEVTSHHQAGKISLLPMFIFTSMGALNIFDSVFDPLYLFSSGLECF